MTDKPKTILIKSIANFVTLKDGVYLCCAQMQDDSMEQDDNGNIAWGEMLDTGEGISLEELNRLFNAKVKFMSKPCPVLIEVCI